VGGRTTDQYSRYLGSMIRLGEWFNLVGRRRQGQEQEETRPVPSYSRARGSVKGRLDLNLVLIIRV
jgi:hypothetical protein